LIQEVSSNALLLHLLVRLCSNWFLGVSSLLHLIINSNLLINSLLISSSVIIGPIELVEVLLHHGRIGRLEVAWRCRLISAYPGGVHGGMAGTLIPFRV
jgi:hypothetical protein